MKSNSLRFGVLLLFAAAVASTAVALQAYMTPLSGVNGTMGALVAIGASLILVVVALILALAPRLIARNLLRVVILIGLIGTGFAGFLLHQWGICAAMLVGLIGLLIDLFQSHAPAQQPARG